MFNESMNKLKIDTFGRKFERSTFNLFESNRTTLFESVKFLRGL